jgi:hypothetical protein
VNGVEREPAVVLAEVAPMLSLLATRRLYEEQPELWKLGERGRAHTLADFNHHFEALVTLSVPTFRRHVAYCEQLFTDRGFPHKWLEDAWRFMAVVVEQELPPLVSEPALAILWEATQ